MPALFIYLIAVGILLGGGYGALDWLATPEPVKVAAKAKPKPPPARDADNSESVAAPARPSEMNPTEAKNSPDANKPEVATKAEINDADQAKGASNDGAVDLQPAASASPEPPVVTGRQEAKAQTSGQVQDRPGTLSRAESPQATPGQEARPHTEAPAVGATRDDPASSADHEEERQRAQAASPSGGPTIASTAPVTAAKKAKRPSVRQASRRSEQLPLEVMTLRTIELPDGHRITQLMPYRGRDRHRDEGAAMAFEPGE